MTQRDKANEVPTALKPYSKTDHHPFVEFDVARKGQILTLSFLVSGEYAFRGPTAIGPESPGYGRTPALSFFWQMTQSSAMSNLTSVLQATGRSFGSVIIA